MTVIGPAVQTHGKKRLEKLRKWWWRSGERNISAYMFLLPSLIIFIVFTFYPAIFSMVASLTRWNLPYKPVFIGFENFTNLFAGELTSGVFWKSVGATLYYALGVPLNLAISLCIALLLNKRLPGVGLFRTAFFLPTITSTAAISVVWIWLYHPADYGLFNSILIDIGVPIQKWLRDPSLAMPCLILMGIWHGMGYNIIIFLAGLQNIPKELYEAAEIDGAAGLARFRFVTWPLLSPTTFYIFVIGIINSLKAFTEIDVMTRGGPLGSTTTLSYYLYQQAFETYRLGEASAVAVILFVTLLVLTLLQFRVMERRVHYG